MEPKDEVFYTKNEHGEFEPVAIWSYKLLDSLPYGSHLVRVSPGSRAVKYAINPDRAAVIAALEYARDAITSSIVESSKASPTQEPVTEMQKEAWDNMKEAFGNDMAGIQFPSAHEIARDVLSQLEFEIEDMLSNENVKRAYDEFALLAKLCGQEKIKSD